MTSLGNSSITLNDVTAAPMIQNSPLVSPSTAAVSVETVAYILLGISAAAPIILLVTVAVVLRCRSVHQQRCYATEYHDNVAAADAWNSSGSIKSDGRNKASNGIVQRGDVKMFPETECSAEPGLNKTAKQLSEMDVREFFDSPEPAVTVVTPYHSFSDDGMSKSFVTAGTSTPHSHYTASNGSVADGPCDHGNTIALTERHKWQNHEPEIDRITASSSPEKATELTMAPDYNINCPESEVRLSQDINRNRMELPNGGSSVHVIQVDIEKLPEQLQEDSRSSVMSKEDAGSSPATFHPLRRSKQYHNIAELHDLPSDSCSDYEPYSLSDIDAVAPLSQQDSARPTPVSLNNESVSNQTNLSAEEEQVLQSFDAIVDDYGDVELTPRLTWVDPSSRVTHL